MKLDKTKLGSYFYIQKIKITGDTVVDVVDVDGEIITTGFTDIIAPSYDDSHIVSRLDILDDQFNSLDSIVADFVPRDELNEILSVFNTDEILSSIEELTNNISSVQTTIDNYELEFDSDYIKTKTLHVAFNSGDEGSGIQWLDHHLTLGGYYGINIGSDSAYTHEDIFGHGTNSLSMRFTNSTNPGRGFTWFARGGPGYVPLMTLDNNGWLILKSGLTLEDGFNINIDGVPDIQSGYAVVYDSSTSSLTLSDSVSGAGGGGVSNHSELDELDFAVAGHYGDLDNSGYGITASTLSATNIYSDNIVGSITGDHDDLTGRYDYLDNHPQYVFTGNYVAHTSLTSVHFTEASIDHTAIDNIGSNSHTQIDAHIASGSVHFTEASISISDIQSGHTHNAIQLTAGNNLDDYYEISDNGYYAWINNSPAMAPESGTTAADYKIMQVMYDGSRAQQMVWGGEDSNADPSIWLRRRSSGQWGSWHQIANENWVSDNFTTTGTFATHQHLADEVTGGTFPNALSADSTFDFYDTVTINTGFTDYSYPLVVNKNDSTTYNAAFNNNVDPLFEFGGEARIQLAVYCGGTSNAVSNTVLLTYGNTATTADYAYILQSSGLLYFGKEWDGNKSLRLYTDPSNSSTQYMQYGSGIGNVSKFHLYGTDVGSARIMLTTGGTVGVNKTTDYESGYGLDVEGDAYILSALTIGKVSPFPETEDPLLSLINSGSSENPKFWVGRSVAQGEGFGISILDGGTVLRTYQDETEADNHFTVYDIDSANVTGSPYHSFRTNTNEYLNINEDQTTIRTSLQINAATDSLLQLVGDSATYISYFPNGSSNRWAYVGFGSTGGSGFTIGNEVTGGSVNLTTINASVNVDADDGGFIKLEGENGDITMYSGGNTVITSTEASPLFVYRASTENCNIHYGNSDGSIYAGMDPYEEFAVSRIADLTLAPFTVDPDTGDVDTDGRYTQYASRNVVSTDYELIDSSYTGTPILIEDILADASMTNLINGTASFGLINSGTGVDNSIFSSGPVFNPTGYTGNPCWDDENGGSWVVTQYIPVDTKKTYEVSVNMQSTTGVTKSYFGAEYLDADKLEISSWHIMHRADTLSTVCSAVTAGATGVTFSGSLSSAWYDTLDAGTYYLRSMIFWDYSNSNGYTYPEMTYSRNNTTYPWGTTGDTTIRNLYGSPGYTSTIYGGAYTAMPATWAVEGGTGHITIPLTSPWPSGFDIPAGTKFSNGAAGSTYAYFVMSNEFLYPDDTGSTTGGTWIKKTGRVGLPQKTGNGYGSTISNNFRPGTKYMRIRGTTYATAPDTLNGSVTRFAELSVRQVPENIYVDGYGYNSVDDATIDNWPIMIDNSYEDNIGGQLGIGFRLEHVSDSATYRDVYTPGAGISFEATNTEGGGSLHLKTSPDAGVGGSPGSVLTRMSITSVGSVGIGTTAPSTHFEVTGTGTFNSIDLVTLSADTMVLADHIYHDGDLDTFFGFPSADHFEVQVQGIDIFNISGSSVTVGSGPSYDSEFMVNKNMLKVDEIGVAVAGIVGSEEFTVHGNAETNGTSYTESIVFDNTSDSEKFEIKFNESTNTLDFNIL